MKNFFFLIFGLLLFSCVKDNVFSPLAQFKLDTTSISAYLKANNIPAIKTQGGFWYLIDTLGVGILPVLTDSVTVAFTERLISKPDEVIDSSDSLSFALSNSIAGIQQGLQFFPAGSAGRLYVPSGLSFGDIPYNNIPLNSNLYYRIKLKSVKSTRLDGDILTIKTYLTTNGIIAQIDPSGILYKLDTL